MKSIQELDLLFAQLRQRVAAREKRRATAVLIAINTETNHQCAGVTISEQVDITIARDHLARAAHSRSKRAISAFKIATDLLIDCAKDASSTIEQMRMHLTLWD